MTEVTRESVEAKLAEDPSGKTLTAEETKFVMSEPNEEPTAGVPEEEKVENASDKDRNERKRAGSFAD